MNTPGIVLHPSTQAQLDAFVITPTHAVLLSGPVGTGKTHIAAALGAQLLDTTMAGLEHHAYYQRLTPKNGTITIEQIRNLISFFRLKVPGAAQIKRVATIEDADAMGTEAQNALLKILEEPPVDSVLVLTSSKPARLLATIQSRVRHLQLPVASNQDLQKHFISNGHTESAVKAALLRSDTNIAETERILANNSDTPDTNVVLVKQALGGTSYERLLLVDPLAKQKENARAFVDTLATIATVSLEAAASKKAATVDRWRDVLQATHTAQDALERNGNTKLALTELMLAL